MTNLLFTDKAEFGNTVLLPHTYTHPNTVCLTAFFELGCISPYGISCQIDTI